MTDISPLQLYRTMLRIRLVEEKIAERYAEQEMRCPVHLSIGQEAVAAGVCAALTHEDMVMSGHRSHAHYLAQGGNLDAMIAEIYGKDTGCCHGRGGSMHLLDLDAGFLGAVPIVGSTVPIATGTAFSAQIRGTKQVSVSFFGEGACEEGVIHESINFAVLKKLPIIFLCENNLYSVYSPLEVRQPEGRALHQLMAGHGISTAHGDGNDVVATYKLARKAVARARRGEGPTFLELDTYRWREHCGPNFDNHIGYRTEAEYLSWRERCPLATFEQKYGAECGLTEALKAAYTSEIEAELEAAFSAARAAPFPKPDALMNHVYAEPQP